MMRWGLFAITLLGVCVVQPTFLSPLRVPWLGHVDAFLMLALACGLFAPPREAPVAGWIVGLAVDLFGAGALGAHAAGLGVAALAVSLMCDWLREDLWWVRLLICVAAAFAAELTAALLETLHGTLWLGTPRGVGIELRAGFRDALLAAAVASLLPELLRLTRRGRFRAGVTG